MAVTKATATIRWMINRDLPQVMAIEDALPHPWKELEFLKKLEKNHSHVCVLDRKVLGYMICEPYPYHYHLMHLAVAPAYRRKGVGRNFLKRLFASLTPGRREFVELCVRESNLDAQLFLKAMNLECDDIIKDYFGDEREPDDMVWENGYHFVYNGFVTSPDV